MVSRLFFRFLAVCIITKTVESACSAKCSPHFTLPCSFGAFDRCLLKDCEAKCRRDEGRAVYGCFCRGSIEGPTLRSCFCGPTNRHTGGKQPTHDAGKKPSKPGKKLKKP
ncbi:unnamed protein product, partial [Mesorhabditis spiculigera]